MKTTIKPSVFAAINKTMAIEKQTGLAYKGEATTVNKVTGKKHTYDVFQKDDTMYVLSSFNQETMQAELKPKDFSKIDAAFEFVD